MGDVGRASTPRRRQRPQRRHLLRRKRRVPRQSEYPSSLSPPVVRGRRPLQYARGSDPARRGVSDSWFAGARPRRERHRKNAGQLLRDLDRDRRGLLMVAEARPRERRVLRRIAASAGLACVFSLALGGGVLLHVRFGAGRRFAASAVTTVLEKTFRGRLVVEKFGSIDADGFDGAEASVYDPEGRLVLAVTGLRGRASLARVALAVLKGGDIAIMIPRARIEHADVTII